MMATLFRIAFCWLFLLGTIFAESYTEWLGAVPDKEQRKMIFRPRVGDGAVTSSVEVRDSRELDQKWSIPKRPPVHPGYLEISAPAGSRAVLFYSQIREENLVPTWLGKNNNLGKRYWGKPMGLLDIQSPIRPHYYRVEYTLDSGRANIPVTLPEALANTHDSAAKKIVGVRAELIGSDGGVLARSLPVEIYVGERCSTTWIFGDEQEADHQLREKIKVGQYQVVPVGSTWPVPEASFSDAHVVWFPQSMLGAVSQESLRRVLLMGVWFHGREITADSLREEVGSKTEACGLGGIAPLDARLSPKAFGSSERSVDWNHQFLSSKENIFFVKTPDLFSGVSFRFATKFV